MTKKKNPAQWSGVGRMPRIVTLDIETAPILAYVWGLFKQFVGLDQIVKDWSILSVTWKWLDEERTYYVDTYEGGRAKDIRDDTKLLMKLWQVLDEADIVVTQNGIQFDIKRHAVSFGCCLLGIGFRSMATMRMRTSTSVRSSRWRRRTRASPAL